MNKNFLLVCFGQILLQRPGHKATISCRAIFRGQQHGTDHRLQFLDPHQVVFGACSEKEPLFESRLG